MAEDQPGTQPTSSLFPLSGANVVFWLVPPAPRAETVDAAYLDFTRPACAAFKTHGVQHVNPK